MCPHHCPAILPNLFSQLPISQQLFNSYLSLRFLLYQLLSPIHRKRNILLHLENSNSPHQTYLHLNFFLPLTHSSRRNFLLKASVPTCALESISTGLLRNFYHYQPLYPISSIFPSLWLFSFSLAIFNKNLNMLNSQPLYLPFIKNPFFALDKLC